MASNLATRRSQTSSANGSKNTNHRAGSVASTSPITGRRRVGLSLLKLGARPKDAAISESAGIPTFIPTTRPNRMDADRRTGESAQVSGLEPSARTGQEELHDLRRHVGDSASGDRPQHLGHPHPVVGASRPDARFRVHPCCGPRRLDDQDRRPARDASGLGNDHSGPRAADCEIRSTEPLLKDRRPRTGEVAGHAFPAGQDHQDHFPGASCLGAPPAGPVEVGRDESDAAGVPEAS